MYLSKKDVKDLTPKKLAELAEEYCNDFAQRLGSYKRINVQPVRICTNLKELRAAYKEKRGQQDLSDCIKEVVLNFGAFYDNDIVYTPLVKDRKLWKLKGFYNEMGHLVEHELYGRKMNNHPGLGEALDIASMIYGKSREYRKHRVKLDKIEALINDEVESVRNRDKLADIYLFYGRSAAERFARKYWSKDVVDFFRTDFLKSRHYSGGKIFLAAYDKADGNFERTLWLLHQTMSNPEVKNAYDALKYLGWSEEKLERYKPFLFNKQRLRESVLKYVEKC